MPHTKPSDFAQFWDAVDHELAEVPANVMLDYDVRPPGDGVRIHRVSFASLGQVTVGGWLAVPDGDGPRPGLVIFPGYKSDPLPAVGWARRGYATFTLAHRGKLGATSPFNPGYPGMLTAGITDPHTYAYRGVYADCMRALEVVSELAETTGPLRVFGYSQGGPLGLFATARRPQHVGALVSGAPFLTAFAYSTLAARTYPYAEIAEYLACHPADRDTVFTTLAYFDALNVIGAITQPLFLFRAGADEICPPYSTTLLRQLAPANTRWHEYEESGHDATGVRAVADAAAFFAETLGAPTARSSPAPGAPATATLPTEVQTLPVSVLACQTPRAENDVRIEDQSVQHPAAATTRFAALTTPDGATAGAYLSEPAATGNRTAGVIVEFSPYASVVSLPHPEDRERHTLITMAHRGQRGYGFADPWMLPGMFDSSERFEQVVADNMAALATLLPTVHTPGTPVIGVGPDWMLAIAAATGLFTHVEVDSFWLTGYRTDAAEFEYPRRELHELTLAQSPDGPARFAWCDPAYWAAQVTCDLLVVCADNDTARSRATMLLDAHPGSHELRLIDERSARESEWRDQRRSELLGVRPATRWQAARSGVRV